MPKTDKRYLGRLEAMAKRYGHAGPACHYATLIKTRRFIIAKCPNHPNADKRGYILQHRLVMEKHIGRYLKHSEVVHHINRDGADNRIENLILFPNQSAHNIWHKNHYNYKCTLICENCGVKFTASLHGPRPRLCSECKSIPAWNYRGVFWLLYLVFGQEDGKADLVLQEKQQRILSLLKQGHKIILDKKVCRKRHIINGGMNVDKRTIQKFLTLGFIKKSGAEYVPTIQGRLMKKEYRIRVYAEGRKVDGPWWSEEARYTLKGARIAARRIINERNGTVFVEIETLDNNLVERVMP